MEYLITGVLLAAVGSLAAVNGVTAVLLWKILNREQDAPREEMQPETPEEIQTRQLAAEAQRRFEQGFVNLMAYDGSPAKQKEAML